MSRSSYGFGSSDPLGELLNRFFGMSPASSPPAVQRVPIGRLLTESSQAKKLLIAHGHQPELGARPLRRTIQTELDNGIAELLLGGEAEPGDTIVAEERDGSVHCTVRKGASGDGADAERGSGQPADDLENA